MTHACETSDIPTFRVGTNPKGKILVFRSLSEDPGPHAVFSLCAKGWQGGGTSGVVGVVVVDVGLGGTLECRGRP